MALYKYATKDLSINAAKAFIHSVTMVPGSASDEDIGPTIKKSTILYACIGHREEWPNEPDPSEPPDNEDYLSYDLHRKLIAGKKIQPQDICHVAPRYDWRSGAVYAMWRDETVDLYDENFYVLTTDNNVYKCLFNNFGAQSTVRPTGFSLIPFTTSDGYKWKYMYTISQSDRNKFLTAEYIPVRTVQEGDIEVCSCSVQGHFTKEDCELAGGTWNCTSESVRQLEVQEAAVDGAIHVIEVANTGSNYEYLAEGFVTKGDKNYIQLSRDVPVPPSSIDAYYNGASVYISGGTGAGQLRRVTGYEGSSRTLYVNTAFSTTCNSDSTCVISPSIVIVGDGAGAQAYSRVDTATGSITEINMISIGEHYTRAEAYISANSVHGSGAQASIVISPPGGHGADAVRELYADKVLLDVSFSGMEGSADGAGYIPADGYDGQDMEFRSLTILADPILNVDQNNEPLETPAVANTSNSPSTLRLTSRIQVSYYAGIEDQGDDLRVGETITTKAALLDAESGELPYVTELGTQARADNALANAVRGYSADIIHVDQQEEDGETSYALYINNITNYENDQAFAALDVLHRSTEIQELCTVSFVKDPEIDTYSGQVLFTQNFQAVTRDPDQTENMKIILDF